MIPMRGAGRDYQLAERDDDGDINAFAALATSVKVRGEAHWYPGKKTKYGPITLIWEKYDTAAKAKGAARRRLIAMFQAGIRE